MDRNYRIALIFGIVPPVVGIAIFLLWLVTRWDSLAAIDIITLYGGTIVLFLVALAMVRFCWIAYRSRQVPRKRLWFLILGCAALLLANFAVAGGIISALATMENRYDITIHNNSPHPLKDIRIFGGGCDVHYGTIEPDETAKLSIRVVKDGELEMTAVGEDINGTEKIHRRIDEHVTAGVGSMTSITVDSDGTINAINEKGN